MHIVYLGKIPIGEDNFSTKKVISLGFFPLREKI